MEPRESRYFVTGDAVFEDRYAVLFLIPKSQLDWVLFTFFGMLGYICNVDSWYTGGETTPDEATQVFQAIWDSAKYMTFLIGMVSDFAGPLTDDSGWLQCDGTAYLISDYPDLYAVIGTTYNVTTPPDGYFCVPDLRGRVRATVNSGETRLPDWADAGGGTGGESDHVLTIDEMPAHSHTDLGHSHAYTTAVGVPINGGLEAPAAAAVPAPSTTVTGSANLQNTGRDQAHNNVQPTMALFTYILAKF